MNNQSLSIRFYYFRMTAFLTSCHYKTSFKFLLVMTVMFFYSIAGISILNLFNTEWNETQFATTSRLQNEPEPVDEINFTPGTPFCLKGTLAYKF